MYQAKTLYLLADGGRIRYIERYGPRRFKTFRKFVALTIHEKPSRFTRDRSGGVNESASTTLHAAEPSFDPRYKVEADFIRAIALDLSNDATLVDIDNMVLVAPANLQKIFRDSLSPSLADKLVKCIVRVGQRTANRQVSDGGPFLTIGRIDEPEFEPSMPAPIVSMAALEPTSG